ncbi:MAG: hypothetical protein KAI50_01840 [Desulfobacterales bacterium]|nr:hypothetical protein [Desulfobacterales bacterium]
MQLNHRMLYNNLQDITIRAKKALGENNFEILVRLGEEHEKIMNDLNQAGLSDDPEILDLIKDIKDVVDELVVEIGKKRDKTGRELRRIGNGKKLVAAYGETGDGR